MHTLRLLALALVLVGAGCSNVNDYIDEAKIYWDKAELERKKERYDGAKELYVKSIKKYEEAYDEAVEAGAGRALFKPHISLQLANIFANYAHTRRPDVNKKDGDWEEARQLYFDAAVYAERSSFTKMEMICLEGQAECVRPDLNKAVTDWAKPAAMYEKAAATYKLIEDDPARAVALRNQAFCVQKGVWKPLSAEGRRLLERSRKLQDERAAELLSDAGGRYCPACGSAVPVKVRYCPGCGHDQTDRQIIKRKERKLSGPGTKPDTLRKDSEKP